MKSFYKLLLLAAGSLFGLTANAQQVSQDEAMTKALKFLNSSPTSQTRAQLNASNLKLAYTGAIDNENHFYVFNSNANEGGFVIVGADEAAREIIAYSDKGKFDYESAPDNVKWWLSQYSSQIHDAIKGVKEGVAKIGRTLTRANRPEVPILLTTTWDQVAPYNSQIPTYAAGYTGNDALATGCVATAGAQVMKYHKWPNSGVGSKSYNYTMTDGTDYDFSVDFENTTYNWAAMTNSYTYDTFDPNNPADIAVGTLMYHVGVATDMNYGQLSDGGSGTTLLYLAQRLADTFKYDKGLEHKFRRLYSDDEWEDIVYSELSSDRPVIYGGNTRNQSGHAFVCDGYKDELYHINWGWSGSCNGYYLLTSTNINNTEEEPNALRPEETGSGGSIAGSSYSFDQEIIIGIKRDEKGNSVAKKIIGYFDGFDIYYPSNKLGDVNKIYSYAYNLGLYTETFEFGVRLVNKNDETIKYTIASENILEIKPHWGFYGMSFKIPMSVTPGDYYVYPLFKDENEEWKDALLPPGSSIPSLNISAPEGIAISKPLTVSNQGYISPNYGKISIEFKNFGAEDITKQILLMIFDKDNFDSVDYIDLGSQKYLAGEVVPFEFDYNDLNPSISKGDYYIEVVEFDPEDNAYYGLNNSCDLFICDDKTINYELSSAEWGTICLPFDAEVPAGMTAYSVISNDQETIIKDEVDKLEMNKPYLLNGAAGTYTFNGPDTPLGTGYKNGILYGNTEVSEESNPVYAPKNSYVLQNNNGLLGFYKVANDNNQKIRQYSAYLKAEGLIANGVLTIDGTTAIDIVNPEEINDENAVVYDLNGARAGNNAKGMVIVNGKIKYIK